MALYTDLHKIDGAPTKPKIASLRTDKVLLDGKWRKRVEVFNPDFYLDEWSEAGILSLPTHKFPAPYTYGIELETCTSGIRLGSNRKRLYFNQHNDSTIEGYEYTSSIFAGEKGLEEIAKFMWMARHEAVDETCGFHLHIGGLPETKRYFLNFMRLAKKMEDEAFSYVEPYRKTNKWSKSMATDLVSKLESKMTDIAPDHKAVINPHSFYGSGYFGKEGWLNALGMIYDSYQQKTVEVRMHHGTMRYEEVASWVYLWMAFAYFVEKHGLDIEEGYMPNSMVDIITDIYPQSVSKELKRNLEARKNKYKHAS